MDVEPAGTPSLQPEIYDFVIVPLRLVSRIAKKANEVLKDPVLLNSTRFKLAVIVCPEEQLHWFAVRKAPVTLKSWETHFGRKVVPLGFVQVGSDWALISDTNKELKIIKHKTVMQHVLSVEYFLIK